jgi:hypothetical protein
MSVWNLSFISSTVGEVKWKKSQMWGYIHMCVRDEGKRSKKRVLNRIKSQNDMPLAWSKATNRVLENLAC